MLPPDRPVELLPGGSWNRAEIEVQGDEAHAGTTPRRYRRDALSAAIAMVAALERLMFDEEDRVRFSGYDVANIKRFAFIVAAAISALGGAMFVLNVGFMSPKLVTIEPSIYLVIFCAVGGRGPNTRPRSALRLASAVRSAAESEGESIRSLSVS